MLFNGTSTSEIINILTKVKINDMNFREFGKYFNASIGTKYQGKSSFIASKIINGDSDFINNAFINTVNDNNIYLLSN